MLRASILQIILTGTLALISICSLYEFSYLLTCRLKLLGNFRVVEKDMHFNMEDVLDCVLTISKHAPGYIMSTLL